MRLLFLLVIIVFATFPLYSNEDITIEQIEHDTQISNYREETVSFLWLYGKFGYSFLTDGNFIVGLDFVIFRSRAGLFLFENHTIGMEYQFTGNFTQSIFRINYTYFYYLTAFGGGVGASWFYNIENNDIGLSPIIGISFNLLVFKIDFNYRYNFVLNNINNNYHEIGVFASIRIPIKN